LEGIWVVTVHDCLVTDPDNAERSRRINVEALGSMGVKRRNKIRAFNLNAQDAR